MVLPSQPHIGRSLWYRASTASVGRDDTMRFVLLTLILLQLAPAGLAAVCRTEQGVCPLMKLGLDCRPESRRASEPRLAASLAGCCVVSPSEQAAPTLVLQGSDVAPATARSAAATARATEDPLYGGAEVAEWVAPAHGPPLFRLHRALLI